jgi:hypothetical protein
VKIVAEGMVIEIKPEIDGKLALEVEAIRGLRDADGEIISILGYWMLVLGIVSNEKTHPSIVGKIGEEIDAICDEHIGANWELRSDFEIAVALAKKSVWPCSKNFLDAVIWLGDLLKGEEVEP